MIKYKIYTLSNPLTNEIRYIGQTQNTLKSRLQCHLNRKDKTYRTNWIQSLLKDNIIPEIKLICETTDYKTCLELEIFYIKKYKDEGYRLVNATDGGDGCIGYKHTEETKKKLSEIAIKRMKDSATINEFSETGKKVWNNKTETEKINNQLNQVNRRSIAQYDLNNNLIKIHVSLRQIERDLGFFRASLTRCLNGINKQSYNFIWKYV